MTSQGTLVGTPTSPGTTLGTLGYMSPEQAKGTPADHRSDQFSFGVVLYELATGERPFGRDTAAESLAALLMEPPIPLEEKGAELPAEVCAAVMRCLSKDPEERYGSTAELLETFSRDGREDQGTGPVRSSVAGEEAASHRTPLAGRDAELAQLMSHLERAIQGSGGLVTLVGEPGVGKTRLTEEIGQLARGRGCVTLVGHCYEGEGAPPYSPWIEILERTCQISDRDSLRALLGEGGAEVAKIYPELRQLISDLPLPLDLPPEQSRPYLFRCFRELVERSAQQQPLLLILEDLHWADDATLLLLEHVAGHLEETPALIVGTYRDVDLEVSRPLAKTLQQLVRERLVEKIALSRLDEQGVARMLDGLSGLETPTALVAKIHDETEGNPFFVEEVYLHLEEEGRLFDSAGRWRTDLSLDELDVPEGVRLVVGRRLERLSREERSALTAAAVIGRRFSYELLEVVAKGDPDLLLDTIERAEQLQLIEPGGRSSRRGGSDYRFSHELIRQTLLTGLSLPRLQRLHLRVAGGIEDTAPDPARRASALAHHLFQAGAAADEEKTLRFLTLAGEQALEAGAFEDALRHFEDALSLLEEASTEERVEVLRLRADAYIGLGRWHEARRDWEKVLPVLEKQGSWEAVTEIAVESVYLYGWQGTPADGVEAGRRALAVLPEGSVRERARILSAWGCISGLTGDFATGDEHTTEALGIAETLGDPKALAEVLRFRALFLYWFMLREEGFEAFRRTIELLQVVGDGWGQIDAESFHVFGATHLGRLDEVPESLLEEVEGRAMRLGHKGAQHLIVLARANRYWMSTGDLDGFRELKARGIEILEETDSGYLVGNQRAFTMTTFWRGEWELARDQAALGHSPLEGTAYEAWAEGYVFFYESYLGNADAARKIFSEIEHLLPPSSTEHAGVGTWTFVVMVAEGLSVLGDKDKAAELYPLVERALSTGARVTNDGLCLIERVAGIAAAAGRQWEVAEHHFEEALRQASEIPFRFEQPEVRRFYAGMLIDRNAPGDLEKARRLLEEAIEGYREIGMPRHLLLVEDELERLETLGERRDDSGDSNQATRDPSGGSAEPPRIAVLPFSNLSGDPEQEYFSDGMAEEVLNALASVEGLRVAARSSAFSFKGKNVDVREVGRRLDVNHVLEGSVRRAGSRLRINAQLVGAQDGYQLWSQVFDREMTDVFEVQEEIAQAIVAALRDQFALEPLTSVLIQPGTENLEAYNSYLRGRHQLGSVNPQSVQQAIHDLEQAVDADSEFADAWGALAWSWSQLSLWVPFEETDEAMRQAFDRTLALDPNHPAGLASKAWYIVRTAWDWRAAEDLYERCIEGVERDAFALDTYTSGQLLATGRVDRAVALLRTALDADPYNLHLGQVLAWDLLVDRRAEEALIASDREVAITPDSGFALGCRALALAGTGRLDELSEAVERVPDDDDEFLYLMRIESYRALGDTVSVDRLTERLRSYAESNPNALCTLAWTLLNAGQIEDGLAVLEQAIEARSFLSCYSRTYLRHDPVVWRHPRFQALLGRMRLDDASLRAQGFEVAAR